MEKLNIFKLNKGQKITAINDFFVSSYIPIMNLSELKHFTKNTIQTYTNKITLYNNGYKHYTDKQFFNYYIDKVHYNINKYLKDTPLQDEFLNGKALLSLNSDDDINQFFIINDYFSNKKIGMIDKDIFDFNRFIYARYDLKKQCFNIVYSSTSKKSYTINQLINYIVKDDKKEKIKRILK